MQGLEKRVETHLRTLQLAQGALPTKQLKMVKGDEGEGVFW
jgi:hypothetical protein